MASLLLAFSYFAIVSYAESFSHAMETFLSIAYLMIPLMVGFGVQVGLYSYSKQYSHMMQHGSANVTACGGLSAGTMIACCIHHVTDVIPIIGITAAASILTAFQPLLITVGLLSNIVGILTILGMIQKHNLYDSSGTLARIMRLNIKRVRNYALVLSPIAVGILAGASLIIPGGILPQNIAEQGEVFNLLAKTIEQGGLTITVTPLPFSLGQEVKFEISFDTHAGGLDFNIAQVASLEDDHGNMYAPKSWDGSPAGGHHREGTISFPPLSGRPHSIKLVMNDIYSVDSWLFEWKLAE